jgi:uncharacterized protein (TIGR03118 family)
MPKFFTQSLPQQEFSLLPTLESLEPRRMMAANSYLEQDLTSNGSVAAAHTDSRLVNPWGMVVTAHGIQIADADSGVSTEYDANGLSVGGGVTIPGPHDTEGVPTGIVANTSTTAFLVNGKPAAFIAVTENGTVDGWASGAHTASIVSDDSDKPNVFKGAAIDTFKHNSFLYAANFTGATINVFNSSFALTHVPGTFTDPNLPKGYSPFNIQNINGMLYVEYARHVKGSIDPGVGAGTGVVDIFSSDGKFVSRFAGGGKLDAPWGITVAPANFAAFSGDVLVGNFGDGRINAFNATTGKFAGTLDNTSGTPISIDGLWGIEFGNGKAGTETNGLYFSAGVEDYSGGLYGRIVLNGVGAVPQTPPQAPPPTSPPIGYVPPDSHTMVINDALDQLM